MAFPSKGDRVAHGEYGPGTITEQDIYHTLIDFDTHGVKRFVTSKVVLERTTVPSPTPTERRSAAASRKGTKVGTKTKAKKAPATSS